MGISLEVQLLGHWPVCMWLFKKLVISFLKSFLKWRYPLIFLQLSLHPHHCLGDAVFPLIARKSFVGMRKQGSLFKMG